MVTEPWTKYGSLHGETLKPQPFQPGKHTQVGSWQSCSAGAYRWLHSCHRPCQSTRQSRLQQRNIHRNLRDAATEGNGVLSRDQVKDHLGCCGGRVETIDHGQIRQKNVHGRTEGWAGKDGDWDELVTCQCDQVGDRKQTNKTKIKSVCIPGFWVRPSGTNSVMLLILSISSSWSFWKDRSFSEWLSQI